MSNDLFNSRISCVFGARPTRKSGVSLRDLMQRRVNAFIALCWKPGNFKKYFARMETLEFGYTAHDFCEQNADTLLDKWNAIVKDKEPLSHLILLPRMKDSSLFNQMRHDLYQNLTEPKMNVILLGDYRTFDTMMIENHQASMFGKELMPEIWLFEAVGKQHHINEWLTGGDSQVIKYFQRHLSSYDIEPNNIDTEIRRIAHHFVTELMQSNSSESLNNRLSSLLETDSQRLIQQHMSEMYDLLPGTFDPASPFSRQNWLESRDNARWRWYSALSSKKQALLLGGLIRYEPRGAQTQFRLCSPLFAYALARHGLKSKDWFCEGPEIKYALEQSYVDYIEDNASPTSLDYYLDSLLNKAISTDDKQDDHWTVAELARSDLNQGENIKPGEWWRRLHFEI